MQPGLSSQRAGKSSLWKVWMTWGSETFTHICLLLRCIPWTSHALLHPDGHCRVESMGLLSRPLAVRRCWPSPAELWMEFWLAHLYQSARAAITEYHRLGGLSNRNLFSLRTVRKFTVRSPSSWCQQGWFLVRSLFLPCRKLPSHFVFTRLFCHACGERYVSLRPLKRTLVLSD